MEEQHTRRATKRKDKRSSFSLLFYRKTKGGGING
jgi:hypothetical protein